MPKFMNAELVAIRDSLECGHCRARFKGTDSQAWKVKYERRTVYCSDACRKAASSQRGQEQALREGKTLRKGVLCGPCKTCGSMFQSRIDKKYCSLDCYIKSDQFKEMRGQYFPIPDEVRQRIAAQLRTGKDVPCLECGEKFYQKRQTRRSAKKFCSTTCYRAYLSKRFDRWIANPEGMALPQCYDEFLDRSELSCVVDGCDWKGKHLTLHVNQAHGLKADDFKRATGFNLSTGVIAKPLAEALRERTNVGVALLDETLRASALALAYEANAANSLRYVSLEGAEHRTKALALARITPGPQRRCKGCGQLFVQSTSLGKTLYCSKTCRSADYRRLAQARNSA